MIKRAKKQVNRPLKLDGSHVAKRVKPDTPSLDLKQGSKQSQALLQAFAKYAEKLEMTKIEGKDIIEGLIGISDELVNHIPQNPMMPLNWI